MGLTVAGYSGTQLPQKLGIKPGTRLALLDAPEDFAITLGELPENTHLVAPTPGNVDVAVYFTKERVRLIQRMETLGRAIFPHGGLWIAWPKKAARVSTDMSEDAVRETALPLGLVDNKVCAIDGMWSGLRVVWRRELRLRGADD